MIALSNGPTTKLSLHRQSGNCSAFYDGSSNNTKPDCEDATALSCEVQKTQRKKTKTVSFSTVQVREFNVTLGVSPQSSFPITLRWDYVEKKPTDIPPTAQKRTKTRLSLEERQIRLQAMGISRRDLLQLERSRKNLLLKEWAFGCCAHETKQPSFNVNAIHLFRKYAV